MPSYKIPGVYNEIDASAAVQAISLNTKVIGIVAQGTNTGMEEKAYAPLSYDDAVTKYGANSNIVKLMKTCIENGASKFIVVQVKEDSANPGTYDYDTALDILELEEAVYIVITDSTDEVVHTKIKEHVKAASENRKERIAFLGLAAGADVNAAVTKGTNTNAQRVFIPYPNPLDDQGVELSGIYSAAAVAAQVAAEQDPSMPMTGVELNGFYGLSKKLKDSEMEALIDAGIIPLNVRNGSITIVRAISTYTKDSQGNNDITWQELTTTTISDYIFKDLRNGLGVKFKRAKQNKKTRDSVKSEVLTRLKTYESLEYIENVQNTDVTIQINPTNPTMNDVIFKYDVVTPMNVIRLVGHLVI